MKKKPKTTRERRLVTIGVLLPVSVTVEVSREADSDLDLEDADWTIENVRSSHCNPSPLMVEEALNEDTHDYFMECIAKGEVIS